MVEHGRSSSHTSAHSQQDGRPASLHCSESSEYPSDESWSEEDHVFLDGTQSQKKKHSSRRRLRSRWSIIWALVGLYTVFNLSYGVSLRPAATPVEMNQRLGKLGALIFLSVVSFSAQFWMGLYYRYLTVTCSLQLVTLVMWYLVDNGNTLESHGSYNLLIFFLMLTPSNIIIAVLTIWYKGASGSRKGGEYRPRRFWKQFASFVIFGCLVLVWNVNVKRESLKYGFFERTIPCSEEELLSGICQSCQWEKATPWFDLLPFRQNFFTGPMTCSKDTSFSAAFDEYGLSINGCDTQLTEVRSYFNDSIIHTFQGPMYSLLPRTESWGLSLKNDNLHRPFNGFQHSVLRWVEDNTFPFTKGVTNDQEFESVLVHCGSAPPKIAYRVQPISPALSEKKLAHLPNRGLNVVVLFIDAMSRNHFHRRLPQTKLAIEALTRAPTSVSQLYEFFRYHSVGINTTPNTRALWAGVDEHNITASHKPLWEEFEDAGYISARADPMCQDWSAYYEGSIFPNTTKIAPKLSHEHISFSCLPPHLPIGKANSGNFAGPASIKARCFSDTHIGWHILDWGSEFIANYQDDIPYHLNAAFMEAHEGSGEVLRTLDQRLAEFFDPGKSMVDFNTTAVVIVSDHGALMGLNNAFFENGKVEAKNPFAGFVLPSWFVDQEGRGERLASAAGRLVTPHDMYETLRGLMGDAAITERHSRGVNLMREGIGDRSCQEAGIDEEFCRCH